MCGFAGMAGDDDAAMLREMIRVQRHRGPDGDGFYRCDADRVSLASCRLAIIDRVGGNQPVSDSTHGVTVVFAGEIVNAPALRVALEARGHRFISASSDTEVLLRAYLEYRERVLTHVQGMFSFVVHDRSRHRLMGGVDRFGIKPLYFAHDPRHLAFATEMKALLGLDWIDRRLDPQALFDSISFHCVPAPQSIVKGIRKLGPAEVFTYMLRTGELDVRRWWTPAIADGVDPDGVPHSARQSADATNGATDATPALTASARATASERCRDAIDVALARWLAADVPVGFALSGGVDSSALVLRAASHHLAAAPTTYFVSLEGDPDDGSRGWAQAVARSCGAVHREVVVPQQSVAGDLDAMVYHLDEPYGGSIPSWFLYRAMSTDVRVAITGLGADELFGNYGKWRSLVLPGRTMSADRIRARATAVAARALGVFHEQYATDEMKRSLLCANGFCGAMTPSERAVDDIRGASPARDPRSVVPWIDWHLQLPHEFLHMTDRLAMAHGVEARPPFLDSDLAQLAWSLPPSLRTDRTRIKGVLLDAVAPWLPAGLAHAPKRPFAFSLDRLLRGPLAELVRDLLSTERLRRQGIFRDDLQRRLVEPHAAGRRELTQPLWSVLMTEMWLSRFVDRGPVVA